MFWLNLPLICFILLNSIEMSDTREKPPRVIPKTIVPESPRVKPVSPKVPQTIVPDNNDVGMRIKPKVIDDDSDGDMRNKLHTFESISLTPTESDSDDYEEPRRSQPPTKHKKYHKHKSRTITIEPDDMSEMLNKTDDDGIKGQLVNLSKGLVEGVKDSMEDMFIDRKRTAKKATVGGIGSFVIIVVMICMIVLIKKI